MTLKIQRIVNNISNYAVTGRWEIYEKVFIYFLYLIFPLFIYSFISSWPKRKFTSKSYIAEKYSEGVTQLN